MFVPVVLGSDKTMVSVATGHTEYYPLYISLENIHNNVHRAHRDAITILAFLVIPKSKYFWRCHAPNRFGTVNMEDNINIK